MRPLPLLALAVLLAAPCARADTLTLKPDHPERYTVVKGDTLWDIAARFLNDPWRWPSVWNKNEQIANPHRIYPGDVIVLSYVNGQPVLGLQRSEKATPVAETPAAATGSLPLAKLNPSVHDEPLGEAIPTIRPDAILPFLTRPLVLDEDALRHAGYVTEGMDGHVLLGSFSVFYARGLGPRPAHRYEIFRPGEALRDPDSGKALGYQAVYLGEAQLLAPGDPAKLEVVRSRQEIGPRDRLLAADTVPSLPYYYPHGSRPVWVKKSASPIWMARLL